MAVTDGQRRLVYAKLEASLGGEAADLLMQMLPYQSHDELATRTDVLANATVLRGEMAELRADLQGEMAELRADLQGEMADLRSELRGEMVELRSELRGEMVELRSELRGEMVELRSELRGEMAQLRVDVRSEVAGLHRWMAGVVAANGVALITALVL